MVSIKRPAFSGDRRFYLSLLLLISLVLGAVSLIGLLARFSLPKENIIHTGNLSDFPPSDQPYHITEPIIGWIVNDGKNLLVLGAHNKIPGGVLVNWYAYERIFIDPSTGYRFDLYGQPAVWVYPDGRQIIAPQGLPRYQVSLKGEEIWVNFSEETIQKYQDQSSASE